jgi:hypothetical protein
MKLLTQELRRKLPPLYATDDTPADDKLMVVKFFTPDANWTWYACEFDGEDTFFGYIDGQFGEWGYFTLSELESARGGRFRLPIERDMGFRPTKFGDLEDSGEYLRGERYASRKTASQDIGLLCLFRKDGGGPACEIAVPSAAFPSGPVSYAAPEGYVTVARNDSVSNGIDGARAWAESLGWLPSWGDLEEWTPRGPVGAICLPVEPRETKTASRRTAGDYAPGASDEFAGSGGPYSTGEYPDDDPSLPDGYDRNVSTSEPTMPQQMTLEGPQDATGVGDGSDDPSRIWAEAMTRGERAYRKAKVAKYAVENGGDNWTNFGSGFELAGSAWVTLHGDNAFVRWAKANRLVRQTAGGYRFEVPGRAHDRAAAYAREVVAVLSAAGVPASHGSEVED